MEITPRSKNGATLLTYLGNTATTCKVRVAQEIEAFMYREWTLTVQPMLTLLYLKGDIMI